jgi:hypothetical protein
MTADELEEQLNNDPRYQALEGPARMEKRKQIYEKLGIQPGNARSYIAKPGTLENDPDGPVHKYVRPGLEAIGMAGGAVLGAPVGGPYGAVAGGALGYAAGDATASLVERLAGERPPIRSLEQAGKETLEGVKSGTIMEALGLGMGKIIPPILAPFAKQFEGENRSIRQAAEERGITLDPHEVMQSRPLALGHKVLENVPFTSGMIQRSEVQKLQALTKEWQSLREKTGAPDRQRMGDLGRKIQDVIESSLDKAGVRQQEVREQMREKIMQDLGSPVSYKDLGNQVQRNLEEIYQGKKAVEGLAWEHARSLIEPNARHEASHLNEFAKQTIKDYELYPSMLDEPVVKQLKDMMKSGNPKYDALIATIPEGMGEKAKQQFIKSILKEEQPGWPVQSLLKLRSALSDAASSHHSGIQQGNMAQGSLDKYGKLYKDAMSAIDKDIEAYGAKSGSDIATALSIARKTSGDRLSFFNPKENEAIAKAMATDAEVIHKALIQPGNAAGFSELKQVAGEKVTQPIKQAFTNHLMGEGGKGTGGLAGLRNTLDRYGRQTLSEVYSPQEVKDLYHLADKSQWMKKNPIGNPFFREMVKSNPSQVAPAILSDGATTAKTLRSFPEMRPHLRQAFVDGIHSNESTPFPTKMIQTINAYPKDVQRQLFSNEELQDFHQLARIIERTKGTVKLAENPSGTAQNLVTFTTAGALIKHPLANAPQALGTAAVAKLYLSKLGRKFLMEGLVTPATSRLAAEIGTKIGAIMAADEAGNIKEKQKKPTRFTPVPFEDEE